MWFSGKLHRFALVATVVLFGFGHWLWQVSSPLGQVPVLDARENLVWAEALLAGELPAEPLYRAMGYPTVLALLGIVLPFLPVAVAGSLLGLLLHWLNAWLVSRLAQRLWGDGRAAWFAGALYGLYPVAVYFAVQLFDITLGISLFLGALVLWTRRDGADRDHRQEADAKWHQHLADGLGGGWRRLLLVGLLLGLGVLVRPHFLPPALALPVWLLVAHRFYAPRFGLCRALSVAIPIVALLLLQGFVNLRIGGEFRILPWQGAYNFYAANREGANGRYFTQRLYFENLPEGTNPTRIESELLYARETGVEPPFSVSAMNAHWQGQAREAIFRDPARWLSLMGRKGVFLVNDWEQYNNFTYAFHKERSPWLRWNPLGWGVLLVLVALGKVWAFRLMRGVRLSDSQPKRRIALSVFAILAATAAAYAAGVLLYFASARFRLPLVPLMAVLAAGAVPMAVDLWRRKNRGLALTALAMVGAACLATFPNWLDARDRSTFIQDAMLLATAAMRTGDDALALEQAEFALSLAPTRPDALRLAISSRYNLVLTGRRPDRLAEWERMHTFHGTLSQPDLASAFIAAVAAWKLGDRTGAVGTWREQVQVHGNVALSSAKALQVVGGEQFFAEEDQEMARLRWLLGAEHAMNAP